MYNIVNVTIKINKGLKMNEFEKPKPQISGTESQTSEFEPLFEKSHGYVEETLEKDLETGVPPLEKMGFNPGEAKYIIEKLRSFALDEGEPSIESSSIVKFLQIVGDLEATLREQGQ